VSGDTAVVGANQDEDAGSAGGSAYVFNRSSGMWSQQAKLTASDGATNDNFGSAVDISGDAIVVGAYGAMIGFNSFSQGAVYIFVRSDTTWSEQIKLDEGIEGDENDNFGRSVAIYGETTVVGVVGDDDRGDQSGSAVVFDTCNVNSVQSGAWESTTTWDGGVVPGVTHGVCILDGMTVTLGTDAQVSSIRIENGGMLDLSTYNLSAETIVWNFGTMQQTRNVEASTTVNFLQIQPSGGGADLYRGLDISTDGSTDLMTTTVRIMGNTAVCNRPLSDGGAYRDRCFMANPTNSGSATVTLHSTTTEDDIADDAFFQHASGTTWTQRTACNDPVGSGGSCTGTATFVSPAYFLIGSGSNNPTVVKLQNLSAQPEGIKTLQATAFMSVAAYAFWGLLVWKRRKGI
jgi:hypothetical protein